MLNLKKIFEEADVQIDIGEVSDGFHTFNSLYHQRLILFAALCNTFKDVSWKSKKTFGRRSSIQWWMVYCWD